MNLIQVLTLAVRQRKAGQILTGFAIRISDGAFMCYCSIVDITTSAKRSSD